MTDIADLSHPQAVAMEVLATYAAHSSLTPFSSRPGGLTLDQSTRVLPMLRAAFGARGEKILGRKIGFTNRSIWAQYGVDAPIWGYVTSATTHDLAAMPAVPARDFCEPRIEPEIMFGLKAAPSPDMDEDALIACIDWLALGYEVVQSPFPDWKFKPADTIAANALHGALLIGERHAFASRADAWRRELAIFTAQLYCNDRLIDSGGGGAVLDSPLNALRHLVDMLAHDPHNPPLAASEIVSTGTLTKAFPVHAGETWHTVVDGIPLGRVALRFA
jgi:2-oxo-3-hexenedioate decarboxylase